MFPGRHDSYISEEFSPDYEQIDERSGRLLPGMVMKRSGLRQSQIRPFDPVASIIKKEVLILSEFLTNASSVILSDIIRAMCNGEKPDELINRFEQECEGISQEQVSGIFNQLNREGLAFQSNPQVVDFYHSVITRKISAETLNQFAPGHPVRVYLEENVLLRSWFNQIGRLDPVADAERFRELFAMISRVEKHFVRKENQLFPVWRSMAGMRRAEICGPSTMTSGRD